MIAERSHQAGLGAVGGVYVSANLHLETLQGCPVAGLEQLVENLAALRFGVIDEKA